MTHETRRLVEWLRAELARATGRRHPQSTSMRSTPSASARLPRDLDHEKQAAVNRAGRMPWMR